MESFIQIQQLISQKLTWEKFESVLKKQSKSDNVKMINISLGKPTKKGDSYLSTIVRFSVEYSGEISGDNKVFKLHVIAKSLIRNIAQRNTFRNSDFFTNEIIFYDKVWPQLDTFQKGMTSNAKHWFQEIPNYLCGEFDGTNDYILLEDLGFAGYQGVDRADALTYDTAKLVLKVLSHFHALGYVFNKTQPELFKEAANKLKETYFHENYRTWYTKFQNNLKNITLDAVQQELPEMYTNKIKEIFGRDIYGETVKLCTSTADTKYKTITHGDTWMPNFLTLYDESKQPLHSIMIDFQLTRNASLAQDLHFFIYACTSAELRAERYEDMLKFYCTEFNKFCSQLMGSTKMGDGADELSYEDLLLELRATGIFALCMCMEASVMSMLDDDEVSDLDEMEGEEAVPIDTVWIVKPLKTKAKRVKLAQIIKHMIDYNFI